MKDISKSIISKFASEVGMSIYKRRLNGKFYDPVTGTTSDEFEDIPVLIAFDDYTDKAFNGVSHSIGETIAYISGQDLPYKPKKDDIIQSFDNTNFLVVDYKSDMYSYAYTILLKQINED
jgi:hypothetical protein